MSWSDEFFNGLASGKDPPIDDLVINELSK